jgi:NAD(P)-dependent dehydrogenase (short-subunit alcohol dehydrogenase family)
MDKSRLDEQVAIITGAGAGIGRGIALALAERGAAVAILDIEPTRAREVAQKVLDRGGQAVALPVDVMDGDALQQAMRAAGQWRSRVDILVNNAGGVTGKPFLQQSERSWRRHVELNLMSLLAATASAVPIMIEGKRGGAILNVASIEATRAAPNYAVYAACKAAMLSFTRSMALELSGHAIRVNAIAPDHTVTPGVRGNRAGPVDEAAWRRPSAEQQAAMDQLIPLMREGVPEECGDAAVYLCSRMSSYVTGVLLPVDGGTWAAGGWMRTPAGAWTLNQGLPTIG